MVNRRIPLSKAVDFCTRSSDEDTDNDETYSDQEDSAANQNETVYGGQTEMLSENQIDDLTSDNEQSETNEMETAENSNRQFNRRKNKYLVFSTDTSLDKSPRQITKK